MGMTARRGPHDAAMRKTITSLLALAAFAAAAQPAAADDPAATTTTSYTATGATSTCQTPDKIGVDGQYGAWGYYIDGCTVRLSCPAYLQVCAANADSRIVSSPARGQRVTLNSRMRVFSSSDYLIWYRDMSCDGTNSCGTADLVHIQGGQSASVQCNGVRQSGHNRANVACRVELRYLY
jgi:hypothetical protein